MGGTSSSRRRRRLWKFGNAEFDEAIWALRVDGQTIPLEAKPLELLHELLLRAGEVVTKDEILDAVWPGVTVVEGSLPTAISKLRKALGERQDSVIETVPRVGYRLTCPVSVESVDSPIAPRFAFLAGDAVPGRRQWRMVEALGDASAGDVWLAQHEKTGEQRVFKFADEPGRLRALKREAALSRVVFAAMGSQAPLPALLEWNFEASPYFLEYAYGGPDLIAWAKAAGGLAAIPIENRLAVAAQIARAVANIHRLGVLHKDLKPANILVLDDGTAQQVRLADFGSGRLVDDAVLDRFQITDPGSLGQDLGKDEPRSGTLAYRAPELVGDAMPTTGSDIYALGLILYQLAAGDFSKALAPGWEANIGDPLLREDIGLAAALDPEQRLASGDLLSDRIERLGERRAEAHAAARQSARVAEALQAEDRRLARLPWVRAAAISLVAGLVGTGTFAAYAVQQRNEARSAQALSQASFRFLAEDVLASVDPSRASSADETLVAAITRSGPMIAQRFKDRPEVAAELYATLARAFDMRSDFTNAFRYYEAADAIYRKAGAGHTAGAVRARLQHAGALALSTQAGSRDRAVALVQDARETIAAANLDDPETMVWLDSALGMIALVDEDVPASQKHYAAAYAGARALKDVFSPTQTINFGQRSAFAHLRLGEGDKAERAFRPLIASMSKLAGPDHPDTLLLRLNLAQAFMVQQKFPEAIAAMDELLPQMEKRLGKEHRHTLLLLAARSQALGSAGRYADAAVDAERVWRATEAKDGAASFAAIAGRADTGISQCRGGAAVQGAGNIRASLSVLEADLAGRTALRDALRAALADCYVQLRRFDEASPLLGEIDTEKVAQLVGDQNFGSLVELAKAEIAAGLGEANQARVLFLKAAKTLRTTNDRFVRGRLFRLATELGEPVDPAWKNARPR